MPSVAAANTPGRSIVDAASAIADGPLAAIADACDREGVYPRAVLQAFGRAGALSAHLEMPGRPADHGTAIAAMIR